MGHDEFVLDFGKAIEVGQASVLVGAGLSTAAGYPSWDDLVEAAANRAGVARVKDPPLWAQYVENTSPTALLDELVSQFGGLEPQPQETHDLLAQLPIPDVWTTNYDCLLETANPDLEVIAQDSDLVKQRRKPRRLYKMHGSTPYRATEPTGGREQLVITRDDYERYPATHPRLWSLLQAQFLTSSFLFLGFSLRDPNFDQVFSLVRRAIGDGVMPHYAVMRKPKDDGGEFDLRRADLARIGIEIIEVSGHEKTPGLLRRLVARTLPLRLFVSGSYRGPSDAEWSDGHYPTQQPDDVIDDLAVRLGQKLAAEDVPGLLAAGEVGANVGYAYLDALEEYWLSERPQIALRLGFRLLGCRPGLLGAGSNSRI